MSYKLIIFKYLFIAKILKSILGKSFFLTSNLKPFKHALNEHVQVYASERFVKLPIIPGNYILRHSIHFKVNKKERDFLINV